MQKATNKTFKSDQNPISNIESSPEPPESQLISQTLIESMKLQSLQVKESLQALKHEETQISGNPHFNEFLEKQELLEKLNKEFNHFQSTSLASAANHLGQQILDYINLHPGLPDDKYYYDPMNLNVMINFMHLDSEEQIECQQHAADMKLLRRKPKRNLAKNPKPLALMAERRLKYVQNTLKRYKDDIQSTRSFLLENYSEVLSAMQARIELTNKRNELRSQIAAHEARLEYLENRIIELIASQTKQIRLYLETSEKDNDGDDDIKNSRLLAWDKEIAEDFLKKYSKLTETNKKVSNQPQKIKKTKPISKVTVKKPSRKLKKETENMEIGLLQKNEDSIHEEIQDIDINGSISLNLKFAEPEGKLSIIKSESNPFGVVLDKIEKDLMQISEGQADTLLREVYESNEVNFSEIKSLAHYFYIFNPVLLSRLSKEECKIAFFNKGWDTEQWKTRRHREKTPELIYSSDIETAEIEITSIKMVFLVVRQLQRVLDYIKILFELRNSDLSVTLTDYYPKKVNFIDINKKIDSNWERLQDFLIEHLEFEVLRDYERKVTLKATDLRDSPASLRNMIFVKKIEKNEQNRAFLSQICLKVEEAQECLAIQPHYN